MNDAIAEANTYIKGEGLTKTFSYVTSKKVEGKLAAGVVYLLHKDGKAKAYFSFSASQAGHININLKHSMRKLSTRLQVMDADKDSWMNLLTLLYKLTMPAISGSDK